MSERYDHVVQISDFRESFSVLASPSHSDFTAPPPTKGGKSKGEKNIGKFVEKITDDTTGKVRENIHTYYMPTNRGMLEIAKEVGFTVTGQVDLVHVLNEYQYLYILKKVA